MWQEFEEYEGKVHTSRSGENVSKGNKQGKEEVEACIKSPDNSIRGEVIKSVRDIGDKVLVVVYRLERNYALVITAFKSSRKEKYLPTR